MSRINHASKIVTVFALVLLVASLAVPVSADSNNNPPSGQQSSGQIPSGASPVPGQTASPQPGQNVTTGLPANSSINVTGHVQVPANKTSNDNKANQTKQGRGKIGNIITPPATLTNQTENRSTDVKNAVNETVLTPAKNLARNDINKIISQLQLYERWVDRSGLDESQKSGIVVLVNENIDWFRQQSANISAAGNLSSIRKMANTTELQAVTLKVSIKQEAGIMACDALDDRISQAENASVNIAARIAALEAKGNNMTAADQKLASYDAHIAAAASYSAAARAAFEGITSKDNVDNDFNEGYQQINLAENQMSLAYADLKEVYLIYLQASRKA